jgi:hypothetical protein
MKQEVILGQYDTPHEPSHPPMLVVITWSGARGVPDQRAVPMNEVVERYLEEEPTWEDAAWV